MTPDERRDLFKFNVKMWGVFLPAIIAAGVMSKADVLRILEGWLDPTETDPGARADGLEREMLSLVVRQVKRALATH